MNLAFQRILVPSDFSGPSDMALEYAHMLARRFGAGLMVIHVVEEPFPMASGLYPPELAAYRGRLIDEANAELAKAVRPLTDVTLRAEVLVGPTTRRILEAATEFGADLIVMGTRGRGAIATFLMGSVAERVVRTADCPVMAVHDVHAAALVGHFRLATAT
jgi:nucleotide-binding universal stress UspA family protein